MYQTHRNHPTISNLHIFYRKDKHGTSSMKVVTLKVKGERLVWRRWWRQ